MAMPCGAIVQLGRDRENTPLLRGRFAAPGMFVVFSPSAHDESTAGMRIDTGAAIHVAGALWRAPASWGVGCRQA